MTRNKRERGPQLPEGDDGRTIANMNVEGMPWYRPERPDLPPPSPDRKNPADFYSSIILDILQLIKLVLYRSMEFDYISVDFQYYNKSLYQMNMDLVSFVVYIHLFHFLFYLLPKLIYL